MMKVWVRHLDVTATMKEEIVSDFGNSHGEKFETFLSFLKDNLQPRLSSSSLMMIAVVVNR